MKTRRPDPEVWASWTKFLDPESLRSNLIVASLYLSAYEILRSSAINQLKAFFLVGYNESGPKYCPTYDSAVLARHKSPLRASLLWLRDSHVINDQDLDRIDAIRMHRNEIAHDLPKFITDAESNVDIQLLGSICELVAKIDRWWIREFEIPINPDFDEIDVDSIDDESLTSGHSLLLQLLLEIATGDEETASAHLKSFSRLAANFDS